MTDNTNDGFESVSFEAGELIFQAGDMATKLYILQSGEVELMTKDGFVFAKLPIGQSFGEQAFLAGGIRGATARAASEVSCMQIDADQAAKMLKGFSPLLVPVFEALLLEQNMHNVLRRN